MEYRAQTHTQRDIQIDICAYEYPYYLRAFTTYLLTSGNNEYIIYIYTLTYVYIMSICRYMVNGSTLK